MKFFNILIYYTNKYETEGFYHYLVKAHNEDEAREMALVTPIATGVLEIDEVYVTDITNAFNNDGIVPIGGVILFEKLKEVNRHSVNLFFFTYLHDLKSILHL